LIAAEGIHDDLHPVGLPKRVEQILTDVVRPGEVVERRGGAAGRIGAGLRSVLGHILRRRLAREERERETEDQAENTASGAPTSAPAQARLAACRLAATRLRLPPSPTSECGGPPIRRGLIPQASVVGPRSGVRLAQQRSHPRGRSNQRPAREFSVPKWIAQQPPPPPR